MEKIDLMEKTELSFTRKKDGKHIEYHREAKRGKETIPSKDQYQNIINKLVTENQWDIVLVIRMGAEMGMSRIEIVNAEVGNIDRYHPRSLWIEKAKLVKRGGTRKNPIYKMRSRDLPLNSNLYQFLMNYIDKDQKFILKRKKGDITKPFKVLQINELYNQANITWSPHKSRHYFRTQLKNWMRKNRCMDDEVVDALMGHVPRGVRESYGIIDWDYKQEVIDKVFA